MRTMPAMVAIAVGLAAGLAIPLSAWLPGRHPHLTLSVADAQPAPGQPPQAVPGTAKVTVHARFADGTKPAHAQCTIFGEKARRAQADANPWGPPAPEATGKAVAPTISGADGNWVVTNLCDGLWLIKVTGGSFAMAEPAGYVLYAKRGNEGAGASWPRMAACVVEPGGRGALTVRLLRFGTVWGQVTSADGGAPIRGATVQATRQNQPRSERTKTDALGQYELERVPACQTTVNVEAEGFVPAYRNLVVTEGQGETVEFKLYQGGYIRGRVSLPADAPAWDRLNGGIWVHFEGSARDLARAETSGNIRYATPDGRFRLGPLLPGTYRLQADLRGRQKVRVDGEWRGEVKGVRVEAGAETKDIVIEARLTRSREPR